MFEMKLRSVGNPDFGQYARLSEPETVKAVTLSEMRALAQAYIDKWNLGGGNWVDPVVKDGKKVIGHFSYNLRFWEGRPARGASSQKEILIPEGGAR